MSQSIHSSQNQPSNSLPVSRVRLANLIGIVGVAVLAGLFIGLAWQESIPALFGIIGLGLLFHVVNQSRSLLLKLSLSFATSFVASFIACSWIGGTAKILANMGEIAALLITIGVCIAHTSGFLLFAGLFHVLTTFTKARSGFSDRRMSLLVMPPIWVWAETCSPSLFPFSAGCLLADNLPLCQLAEIGGIHLVSVYAASLAIVAPLFFATCFEPKATRRIKSWLPCVGTLALVGGIACWGNMRLNQLNDQRRVNQISNLENRIRILVVQSKTGSSISNERMIKVSRSVQDKADLILWPEAALGSYNQLLSDFSDPQAVIRNSIGMNTRFQPFPQPNAKLLAGSDTWVAGKYPGKPDQIFVSALLFDKQERLVGRHDKIELMPYGEYIPGESILPSLRSWFGNSRIISRGSNIEPIGQVKGQQIGVVLCCEDMHPYLTSQLAMQDADILVSLGNGMAFDSEAPLRQHFRISRMRAIETRKPFVRCMSHGVSVLISPTGKIVHELPCLEDGAMLIDVYPNSIKKTLFTRFGNIPVSLAIAFSILLWLHVHWPARLPNNQQSRTQKKASHGISD